MRDFILRASQRMDRLEASQIQSLVSSLIEDNELLEMVLSSMDRGIIVSDNRNRILLINRHLRRFLPMKVGHLQDQNLWESIEDKDIAQFVQEVLVNLENIREKHYTLDMGGRMKTISLSILPLVKAGSVRGNLVMVEDITQRKAEETRLRRAESLISLTTLTAGIAHEIKNPLGSIAIYIQLMEKILKGDCSTCKEELQGYLEIINEEVDRLNSIVVDYLFAVKPLDTNLEPSDLNKVIEELVDFIGVELEEKKINLQIELEKKLPCLSLDDKLMKQVLLNLVKNAEAAMEEGGVLKIQTTEESDHVIVRIEDSGEGIPEELRGKIFEPYFTTKDNGTGLGLTLVYKIVKEHGGDIEVQSKENRGTSFSIYLPIPQKEHKLLTWEEEENDL